MVRQADLATSVPPDGGREAGSLPASRRLSLDVVLAPSNDGALQALLRTLYTPGSPGYHRWLGRGRFAQLFGPSRGEIGAVEAWLHHAGLPDTSVSGSSVRVSGSVAQVSSALGTSFAAYRADTGSTGYLAQRAPLIPRSLAGGQIAAILGLDSLSGPSPEITRRSTTTSGARSGERPAVDGVTPCAGALDEASPGYYTLDELGAAYGVGSLLADGQVGHGQTIGVYELATHAASDVDTYESCFGLTNPVDTVAVDGGGGAAGGGGTVEADLDIEQAATQAPGATVISYEGPDTSAGDYDVWGSMVSSDAAQVLTASWGLCEPLAADDGMIGADTGLLEQAATQGQTVLVATGDSGSEGCYEQDQSTAEEVSYPASDPWATAVGGTSLFGPGDEVAWNNCQDDESTACADDYGDEGAGGGGLSRYESRPSYEPNLLSWPTAQTCGQHCRELPDISANAGIGMVVYADGGWAAYGGTSYAAPFMAGLAADRNDGCVQPTGAWAPELYAVAAEGSYGAGLTDVTSGDTDLTGSNGGAYPATAGFDAATGLGSPEAAGLSCPEVTSVGAGYEGAHVDISGLGLEHATFTFGGTAARVLSSTATSAIVVVPEGTGSVTVQATSVLGVGTQDAWFTYGPVPIPVTNGTLPSPIVGLASLPDGKGYWLADAQGGVSAHGAAVDLGSMAGQTLNAPIAHIVATPDGRGYWLVAADGGTFAFGDAGFYGSMGGKHLNAPVVDIAPTEDGKGYWLVASDGGIFAFGDAPFHGSMGGKPLNRPIVGVAPDFATGGYWEVATDGGIFAFGAPFLGSTGATALNRPVNGMAPTPNDEGYWFVASDGGVFSFGNARFLGSMGGAVLNAPVVGMATDGATGGYWLVASDGGLFNFDAPFYGGD
jgi:hypothetical protein